MDQVESPEGSSAKSYHTWIQRESTIMAQSREIYSFDPVLLRAPPPRAALDLYAETVVLTNSQICGQHGHLVSAPGEPTGQGAHFDDRPALFLEGIVSLNRF
jgi:hypothetical protein